MGDVFSETRRQRQSGCKLPASFGFCKRRSGETTTFTPLSKRHVGPSGGLCHCRGVEASCHPHRIPWRICLPLVFMAGLEPRELNTFFETVVYIDCKVRTTHYRVKLFLLRSVLYYNSKSSVCSHLSMKWVVTLAQIQEDAIDSLAPGWYRPRARKLT